MPNTDTCDHFPLWKLRDLTVGRGGNRMSVYEGHKIYRGTLFSVSQVLNSTSLMLSMSLVEHAIDLNRPVSEILLPSRTHGTELFLSARYFFTGEITGEETDAITLNRATNKLTITAPGRWMIALRPPVDQ